MKHYYRTSGLLVVLFITALLLLSFKIEEEDKVRPFYYGFDEKIEITKVSGKILVEKKLTQNKSEFKNSVAAFFSDEDVFDWQSERFCRISFKDSGGINEKLEALLSLNEIESVSNVYKTTDGLEIGFTNEIVVKFKDDGVDSLDKMQLYAKHGLRKSKTTKVYEMVSASKHIDIIELANSLYESNKFEFAYPNIICSPELFSTIPNDPYFQFQITLHNTGQTFNGHSGTSDADIDAPEAWDFTQGNNDIIIAVFDEGVTSNHPDLPNSRQVRLNGSNFGSGDVNDPSPQGNGNHGNSCAGVIGATMNNNEGIAGIAPNCRIMPLRWDVNSTPTEMADGIEFAVDNGANIISNSWGFNDSNNNLEPAIVSAIQYAINNNVVVIFAAGNNARHNTCNDDGFVTFPANANVNSLLTVGASDRNDLQADYSPTDVLIDIVAPSHRAYPPEAYSPSCGGITGETLEMWTIDIPGNSGYNPWPSTGIHPPTTGETLPNTGTNHLSYTGRFGGTSHACPVVAGVAALVLSVDDSLTPHDVFDILTGTADQIGGYNYPGGGPSDETGWGRVNAFNAVQQVCSTTNFTNENVTSNTTVEGCDVNVQNVTVSNSKLTIDYVHKVEIDPPFSTGSNAELDIK